MMRTTKEESIKSFWEARGTKYNKVPFESLSNFEEDPQILNERITAEKHLVFSKLLLNQEQTVLDLGAGVGQWAFRFAPLVHHIVAVEFAASQIDIAKQEQVKREIDNIHFVHSPAEKFVSSKQFDIIFISGLIIYLNDKQLSKLIHNVKNMLKTDGIVFLRESTSVLEERYEIIDQYSEALKTNYSATYRTAGEINSLFEISGFKKLEDGQIFTEGSILNKFPETRLKYYVFKLDNQVGEINA